MDKNYRYWLEATWQGHTKRLWGADKRIELDEYIAQNSSRDVYLHVVDTLEEEVNVDGRRHRKK